MKGIPLRWFLLLGLAACNNVRGEVPDGARFSFPTAVVADPDGDFAYVVSTNFDSFWQRGWVTPVRLDPPEVLSDAILQVGSFGGDLVLDRRPDGSTRGYLSLRDGDALAWFGIGREGEDRRPALACELAGKSSGQAVCLEDDALVLQGTIRDEEGDALDNRDPFALALGSPVIEEDDQGAEQRHRPLYVGSLQDGVVMVLDVPDEGLPVVQGHLLWDPGLHSLVEVSLGDGRRAVYGTTRNRNAIHSAVVTREDGAFRLSPRMPWTVPTIAASGDYGRGIAPSGDGRRLYVSWRSPAALLVLELDREGLLAMGRLVPLSGSPGQVAVHRRSDGRETVWVTDFAGDSVYGVDPEEETVLARVAVGEGPYGIAIAGDRALITNFESQDVSVLDLNPGEPDRAHEIARIP
ncbi:YncE family protein [Myxococcota bacterium]|nr:YncE family protein [Myxococcota bacterium]